MPRRTATPNCFYAALENNADAIVLQGVGAGNAPPTLLTPSSCRCRTGTRGPISSGSNRSCCRHHGNGGAVTLLEAGALSAGELNTYQVRILLAILVSQQLPVETFRDTFAQTS